MQERETSRRPEHIYRRILDALARGEETVLATVISRSGSGPREPGATMVISADGETLGTVGGGLLEAQTLQAAKDVLRDRQSRLLAFTLTNRQASGGGMICGGTVEVLVDYMDGPDPALIQVFERIMKAGEENNPSYLVTSIQPDGDKVKTGMGFARRGGSFAGSLDASIQDLDGLEDELRGKETAIILRGDVRYFVQRMNHPGTVFIFGAGHVGRELATICGLAGFEVAVIDDRSEFANSSRFPGADRIVVVESYENCTSGLDINRTGYIVIVTRGHAHDRTVLSNALRTDAGYIGMIASRRKRDIIYKSLLEEGFAAEDLARVHSPIGLEIGARTPAEIAVSIAAELIALRSGSGK